MNRGPGSNTSSRVAWPGFRVIGDAAEASNFTAAAFVQGDQWLGSTSVPFSLGDPLHRGRIYELARLVQSRVHRVIYIDVRLMRIVVGLGFWLQSARASSGWCLLLGLQFLHTATVTLRETPSRSWRLSPSRGPPISSPDSFRGRRSLATAVPLLASRPPPSMLPTRLPLRCRGSSWPVTRRLPAPDTPRSTTRPRTGATARQRILLLDGCDYEYWLIVMEFPEDPKPSEDEMIGAYFKTLAAIVGSEEEAKTRIYSVSTTTYTGFGALISEELSYKVKGLPGVLWVLPDSYLDVPNKDHGGDLFVDGKVIHRPQFRFTERQQTRTRP
ncbi:hypothetical protein C4D60_Mb11t13810 [Musa balbisiana]|uniref:Uncharacterized protein n=1 Tax=Musa balbisiana TaxID=52838 RepID=A0A4S8J403_MUSBA|nr:hypothetical protein C4D60_Mb11t13810 [Musa balbisiana]